MDNLLADFYLSVYIVRMATTTSRKYNKTKFEGVYFRESTKRDPHTGKPDLIYVFWYQDADGKGHWKTVGRHSKGVRPTTARNARAKFLADFDATGVNPVQLDKVTVGHVIDAYLEWGKSEGKSIDVHYSKYRTHLQHKIHSMLINDLTPNLLSALKAQILKESPVHINRYTKSKTPENNKPGKTLAPQTVNSIFAFLRAAINHAITAGIWKGINPLSTQVGAWKKLKENNARLRFLTKDEAKALLDDLRIRHPQLHDMVLLSLRTGLRPTEIFKLRGQDVDPNAKGIHILQKGGDRVFVRIPDDMVDMLLGYNRRPQEPIFQHPANKTAFKKTPSCFRTAIRKLNLAHENGDSLYAVTLHTMRHTFASWLAQSGQVSLIELQKLMRHKNIEMTMRYAHLLPGQENAKLSIISDMLE